MIRAGVVGTTGYTGLEVVRLLLAHPEVHLEFACARSEAGRPLSELFAIRSDIVLQAVEAVDFKSVDVVFLCLPHGVSHALTAAALQAGVVVIDLSADHRLQDAAAYRTWYGIEPPQPEVLGQAVYGLTELYREAVARATLVANPGCYPTSLLLGIAPLLSRGLVEGRIIADCKSGTTGAGRTAQVAQLFAEVNENFRPYSVGHAHRHVAEIDQEIKLLSPSQPPPGLIFSPHLLPVSRGILSTIYVSWPAGKSRGDIRDIYRTSYEEEPFVWLLPEGQTATLQHVVHTNRCAISLHPVEDQDTLIVVSCIDNLLKGAAGQAVQNMNVRFGRAETLGLVGAAQHPVVSGTA